MSRFPRSKNYLNHLHCISDQSIEIYSIMDDYFIDQNKKCYGAVYRKEKYFKFGNSSTYSDNFFSD